VCSAPDRLCPAIRAPLPDCATFSRNEPAEPSVTVVASPSRRLLPVTNDGNAGALGLCAVTAPLAFTAHRNTGAESPSTSSSSDPGDTPERATRWLSAAGS